MTKYIKTRDTFDNINYDNVKHLERFIYCTRMAKKYDVFDTFGLSEQYKPLINLYGKKWSMFKYYLSMLRGYKKDKLCIIKRLISIMLV